MIIDRDSLLELKLNSCFSDYNIRRNRGVYERCVVYIKDTSDLRDDSSFTNEELWESEHVLDSMLRTRRILDTQYHRDNLRKIMSISKHLSNDKQSMFYDVLTKYELLFDGTLGSWKKNMYTWNYS